MDSSSVPVITGLVVGITFIIAMIVVVGSSERYGIPFYRSVGMQVVTDDPDTDDVDGCCDDVDSLTFGYQLELTPTENDH